MHTRTLAWKQKCTSRSRLLQFITSPPSSLARLRTCHILPTPSTAPRYSIEACGPELPQPYKCCQIGPRCAQWLHCLFIRQEESPESRSMCSRQPVQTPSGWLWSKQVLYIQGLISSNCLANPTISQKGLFVLVNSLLTSKNLTPQSSKEALDATAHTAPRAPNRHCEWQLTAGDHHPILNCLKNIARSHLFALTHFKSDLTSSSKTVKNTPNTLKSNAFPLLQSETPVPNTESHAFSYCSSYSLLLASVSTSSQRCTLSFPILSQKSSQEGFYHLQ